MKWSSQADNAIARVPFFVRKRVRNKIEEYAGRCGAGEVGLEHVNACQKKFLNKMEDKIKGFSVGTCFEPDCMKNSHGYDVIMANRLIEAMNKSSSSKF